MRITVALVGLAMLACRAEAPPPADDTAAETVPPDSLAMVTASGTEVWFVAGQEARAVDGTSCYVRGLEIRAGETRRGIPLVYTLEAPTPLDDTTMKVVQYRDCRPTGSYRVDYATASPRRLPDP